MGGGAALQQSVAAELSWRRGWIHNAHRGASCAHPDGTTPNMLTVSATATGMADVLVVAVLANQYNNVLSVMAFFMNDISLLQGM